MLVLEMRSSPSFARVTEAALWTVLVGYIFVGLFELPFHADEPAHIHASRINTEAITRGDLEALTRAADPRWENFDLHRASITLTVAPFHTYIMGAALYAAGLRETDTGRGWTWEVDYEENVKRGHRPDERWLRIARTSSTLFLAASVVVLFALSSAIAGRGVALATTILYALSPLVLLHGRRAMLEGPFLFFVCLALWAAARIVKCRALNSPVSTGHWILLAGASGIAVATKHTAVLFVAVAFIWVAYGEILSRTGRQILGSAARLSGAGLAAIVLFGILSPITWNSPVQSVLAISKMREDVMHVQIHYYGKGEVLSTGERLGLLVRMPFVAPLEAGAVAQEDQRYENSPWSGLRLPTPLAWVATLLFGLGLATALSRAWRASEASLLYWGVLAWSLACLVLALMNPIAWQRYLVPVLPLAYFLTSLGGSRVLEWFRSLRSARASALRSGASRPRGF